MNDSIEDAVESGPKFLLFRNCQIFHVKDENQDPCLRKGKVLVDISEGVIKSVEMQDDEEEMDGDRILASSGTNVDIVECCGNILAPGFIDVQLNGAFGVDFSSLELSEEQVQLVSERLPIYGVTSFCPTIISSTPELYKRNTPIIGQCQSKNSKILGLHLEGPLFQPSQRGAHALENIISEIHEEKK